MDSKVIGQCLWQECLKSEFYKKNMFCWIHIFCKPRGYSYN